MSTKRPRRTTAATAAASTGPSSSRSGALVERVEEGDEAGGDGDQAGAVDLAAGALVAGLRRRGCTSTKASTHSGMLTQKIPCQPSNSVRPPEMAGAAAWPTPATAIQALNAVTCSRR